MLKSLPQGTVQPAPRRVAALPSQASGDRDTQSGSGSGGTFPAPKDLPPMVTAATRRLMLKRRDYRALESCSLGSGGRPAVRAQTRRLSARCNLSPDTQDPKPGGRTASAGAPRPGVGHLASTRAFLAPRSIPSTTRVAPEHAGQLPGAEALPQPARGTGSSRKR